MANPGTGDRPVFLRARTVVPSMYIDGTVVSFVSFVSFKRLPRPQVRFPRGNKTGRFVSPPFPRGNKPAIDGTVVSVVSFISFKPFKRWRAPPVHHGLPGFPG